ncbi:hypothetical protein [Mesorhizobium waimense]|uniref:hypothetical protein n=1 Tax=Mesorhizobium waimense TaxID=1300307 RepID=UPI001FDFFC7F|nr:hypothetical protein [Mesorhizobium waimense]
MLIGDASGADAEAQGLLAGYRYEHVGVFHAGKEPRNNLGDWAAYHVPSPDDATGYWVHAAKDREMARRADFGMMVWDGASPGTAVNVLRLAMANKPCVIYDWPGAAWRPRTMWKTGAPCSAMPVPTFAAKPKPT